MENYDLSRDRKFYSAAGLDLALPKRSTSIAQLRYSRINGRCSTVPNRHRCTTSHLPLVTYRFWNSRFALPISHMGAGSLRVCTSACGNVACRGAEEIWPIRAFASGHSPSPRGRTTLDNSASGPAAREYHLRRAGHNCPEAARLDARLLERDAHGLHLSRHCQRWYSWCDGRGRFDVRTRPFDCAAICPRRRNTSTNKHVGFRRAWRSCRSHAVRRPRFWPRRIRGDRSSRIRKFCWRSHDLFWRVQERLDNGRPAYFSNRHGACALGRCDLDGLHAASLSQNFHGYDERAVEAACRSSPGVACAGDTAGGRASLLRIFPAILRPNRGARVPHVSHRKQIMRITVPELEIAVLVLGMVILMVEAFATKIDKRILAFAAVVGLAIILLASFFVVPSTSPNQATGFWSFYTADRM